MVYVSQATEFGTVYSKEELKDLYQFCRERGLYVFVDGARLAAALVTKEADMELADMVNLSDAFYIGGTKAGLLFGEALVLVNDDLKHNFRFQIKQRGGLFAKGYLLGVQFEVLFKEKLYLEIRFFPWFLKVWRKDWVRSMQSLFGKNYPVSRSVFG